MESGVHREIVPMNAALSNNWRVDYAKTKGLYIS
jgi:hypothetical protein